MKLGIKITKKPRCNICGNIMHTPYYRMKLKGANHKRFEPIPNKWYCPECDRFVREE